MIKRILVGLGGTPFTPTAIRYAVELAQVHQTEVPRITVIDRRRLGALIRASGTAHDAIHELKRFDSEAGAVHRRLRVGVWKCRHVLLCCSRDRRPV